MPPAGSEIWAARLAIALYEHPRFKTTPLPKNVLNRRSAFVLDSRESELGKLFALESLLGVTLYPDQKRSIGSMLAMISRTLTMPQVRDRIGSIVDLRAFVARQEARSLPPSLIDVFGSAIEALEIRLQGAAAELPPALRVTAALDVDRQSEIVVTSKYANEGTGELRDISASLTLQGRESLELGYRETLAAGEAAIFRKQLGTGLAGDELKVTFRASFSSEVTPNVEQSMVLKVPDNEPADEVPNPYYTGMPIPPDDPQMFFGRQQQLIVLTNLLSNARVAHIPLVYGQRRTGKTSLLNRM